MSLEIVAVSCVIPLLFLGFIRLFDYRGTDRDNVASIHKRILGATVATGFAIALTYLYTTYTHSGNVSVLECLGFTGTNLVWKTLWPVALTVILFLGPLYVDFSTGSLEFELNWITVRNMIVTPVTEELCFRSCVVCLLGESYSLTLVVIVSPLLFSLSHLHHLIGHSHSTFAIALQQTCFQAGFTYLFGMYATFLLCKTGTIYCCILAHSFCNFMGFPDLDAIHSLPDENGKSTARILYKLAIVLWTTIMLYVAFYV